MAQETPRERTKWRYALRYVVGVAIGCLVFIGAPEAARWWNGGPFAQAQQVQPPTPPAQSPSGNCNNYGTNQGTINNNCNNTYNMPPRRQNGLYQDNEMVGQVSGVKVSPAGNQVIFQDLRISSSTVDLRAPLEFQGAVVSCPILAPMQKGAAMTAIVIGGETTCDVVGKRQ
jgi:hypothetical protein